MGKPHHTFTPEEQRKSRESMRRNYEEKRRLGLVNGTDPKIVRKIQELFNGKTVEDFWVYCQENGWNYDRFKKYRKYITFKSPETEAVDRALFLATDIEYNPGSPVSVDLMLTHLGYEIIELKSRVAEIEEKLANITI